jgi:hypothetical protein
LFSAPAAAAFVQRDRQGSRLRGCNPFPARTEIWRSLLAVALLSLYNSISGGWDCDEQGYSGYWSRSRAIALGYGRFGEPVARRPPGAAGLGFCPGLDLGEFYDRIKACDEIAGRPATDPQVVLAVWLYATMQGIGAARAVERLCQQHAAYRQINDTSPPKPGFAYTLESRNPGVSTRYGSRLSASLRPSGEDRPRRSHIDPMLRQARHFSDPSRQCCAVELVDHSAEPLFTGHLRLRCADQKA